MTDKTEVTQADFEAIMDRLEKGPMNLTGKSWRDTPDDPALAELREQFILPVIEEYAARHRTAAQPEREAALEDAVKQALLQVEKYAEFFCEEDFDPLVDQLRSALTTPTPVDRRPHCSTCGKDVPEILCPVCAKWWSDNLPVDRNAALEEAAAVTIRRDIFDFLMGIGALDGYYFGERHPDKKGAFWWREHLRAEPAAQVEEGE